MARAGGWERAALHGHVPKHPTPQAAGTEYFSLEVEDVLAAGSRLDRFAGVRPQGRIHRRTVEQNVDAPLLLTLDSPAPLMVEQLVEVPTILTPLFIRMLQNVDIPVPVESLQDLRPGQSSALSSHSPAGVADDAFEGCFRTFSQDEKSATLPPHSGSALPPHLSPWTPAACDVSMAF